MSVVSEANRELREAWEVCEAGHSDECDFRERNIAKHEMCSCGLWRLEDAIQAALAAQPSKEQAKEPGRLCGASAMRGASATGRALRGITTMVVYGARIVTSLRSRWSTSRRHRTCQCANPGT